VLSTAVNQRDIGWDGRNDAATQLDDKLRGSSASCPQHCRRRRLRPVCQYILISSRYTVARKTITYEYIFYIIYHIFAALW